MSTPQNSPIPDPPHEEIQRALDDWMQCELAQFASNLETARSMWRRFRKLGEAPKFPAKLRAAFVEEHGQEPDDACDLGEEVLEPGYRESCLPQAVEIASARGMRQQDSEEDGEEDEVTKFNGCSSSKVQRARWRRSDRSLLKEMGISLPSPARPRANGVSEASR